MTQSSGMSLLEALGGASAAEAVAVVKMLGRDGKSVEELIWQVECPTAGGGVVVPAIDPKSSPPTVYLTCREGSDDAPLFEVLQRVALLRTCPQLQLSTFITASPSPEAERVLRRIGGLQPDALIVTLTVCYLKNNDHRQNAELFSQAASAVLQEDIALSEDALPRLDTAWKKYVRPLPESDFLFGLLGTLVGSYLGEVAKDARSGKWLPSSASGAMPGISIAGRTLAPFAAASRFLHEHASIAQWLDT